MGKWCLLYHSLAIAFGLSYISFKTLFLFPSFASTNSFYSCKNMFFSTDNREVKWNMRRLMEMFWEVAVSIQESLFVWKSQEILDVLNNTVSGERKKVWKYQRTAWPKDTQ